MTQDIQTITVPQWVGMDETEQGIVLAMASATAGIDSVDDLIKRCADFVHACSLNACATKLNALSRRYNRIATRLSTNIDAIHVGMLTQRLVYSYQRRSNTLLLSRAYQDECAAVIDDPIEFSRNTEHILDRA